VLIRVRSAIVSRDADTTSPEHTMLMRVERSGTDGPKGACLVVIYGQQIGRRIELTGAPLVIGRSPRSDLQLDEESVSRQHVRIEPDPKSNDGVSWQIVDLDSTNGTYVNDLPVRVATLRNSDQIQVGRSILRYLAGNSIERAYHEEIYKLMSMDGLTQLRNRRAFDEALADEMARAQRFRRPLSICVMDADKFKSVNDQYGHLAGDAVLRQLGTILRNNIRKNDIAGRLGGEEFGLLLPEVDRAGGLIVAEKLRRMVEAHRFEFDRTVIPVTISIGLAEVSASEREVTDVVRRADELLYRAKHEGRNRVVG
jgi:two-component system cell cycle response regulator